MKRIFSTPWWDPRAYRVLDGLFAYLDGGWQAVRRGMRLLPVRLAHSFRTRKPRSVGLRVEQLEPLILMDAGAPWADPHRISQIAPSNLGAVVSPADPQIASVWSGTGAGWNASTTGSATTSPSLADPGSSGTTPAGGQYRLPGAAAPTGPSNPLTAQVTDADWLAALTANAAAFPVDPAFPMLGSTNMPFGMPGYARQNGAGTIAPPASGNTSWNYSFSFNNPDGTTTTFTSSGASTDSSGPSGSPANGGMMSMTFTQDVTWISSTNTLTTDAAHNVLAEHTQVDTAHYQRTSTMSGTTTQSTLDASGSADTYDYRKTALHQANGNVTDDATVETTDTHHSDYALNQTDSSSYASGSFGMSMILQSCYAYSTHSTGSHHLHGAGTATLLSTNGSNAAETYVYDEHSSDQSSYTENADTFPATPTLTSTYSGTRSAGATWNDQGQSDILTSPLFGNTSGERNDIVTGQAVFAESCVVGGTSNSGVFTVRTQSSGSANRSAADTGTDTFQTAATLAGQSGTVTGAEQFDAGSSASVTASADRTTTGSATSASLQNLSVTGAYASASHLDVTGTVVSASPTSNVGGTDQFATHRHAAGNIAVSETGNASGVTWALDRSGSSSASQENQGSETCQAGSGSQNNQSDTWNRHIDSSRTDATHQDATYNTASNSWTVTSLTLTSRQVDTFTNTFLGNGSRSANATGAGTMPSGTETLTAYGTAACSGSVLLDTVFTGGGSTYTLSQHQVVTSATAADQNLADIGNVTVGLVGTGTAGASAGTPPAAGSQTDKNNDTWNRHIDGTETDTTDQTTIYDTTSNAWTMTAYSFGTHAVQNFTDTLVNSDSSKVDATGSGATPTDPSGSDLQTATGAAGSNGSVILDSLLTWNGQTYTQTQHQVVSRTFSSDQKLTDVGTVTAGLAGTGTSGGNVGTPPPPASGSETDKSNDTWNRHIDGAETDTTDQKAIYDTISKAWTVTVYSFGTHVVQNITDTLVNSDSSKVDATGSGATPSSPNGSDLETATGTAGSSGSVILDSLLTWNGQTYTLTQHQVVSRSFSSNQTLTDVGTVTAGLAGTGTSGASAGTPPAAAGSETDKNNDTWNRHIDGIETDTTDQSAIYDMTAKTWTLTAYSFGTHVVQNFTNSLVNSDSSKVDVTGSGATASDPSGSDLETATGTDGSSGTITLDTLLTGNGQTYTQTQHQVVTWTFSSDQKLTDVGTVTVGLPGTGTSGGSAGTPPPASGSETDKSNDTWNRHIDGTETDITDQKAVYDTTSKAWTLIVYSFGTHVVQNFTDTLVNSDTSKVDATGSGATPTDPNGSDLATATGNDGSSGSITSDSLLIGNGQTFIQTQHQVVSWTFSSDQKLTDVGTVTAGLAGTGTSGAGTGTPSSAAGSETDKTNDTWNRHIDGTETDTTDLAATYSTTTNKWTLTAYSFATHVVQNFADTLVNSDSSKLDKTGSGATATDPNGSDLETATGTDGSTGSITSDSLLIGNGQTYTQTQHQVVTWTFSSNQTLTDVGTVTAGLAGAGTPGASTGTPPASAGSDTEKNNDTWTRHTDGAETDTTDQKSIYDTTTNAWTLILYSFATHVVQNFTDTLVNSDSSKLDKTGSGATPTDPNGSDLETATGTDGSTGSITSDSLLIGNGQTYTQTQHQVVTWTFSSDQTLTDVGTVTAGLAGTPGASAGTPPAASGSDTDKNNDTWTRHIDGAETDITDLAATYSTTTNKWTLTTYSFATHVVQNFTDTLVNNDSSKVDETGSGATPTDPNGSDLETATGTDGSTGSITSDSVLIGNGQTYTQTQHQVVTWTFSSNQTLTDVGTVTAGLAGAGTPGASAGTPPASAGSDMEKNNDTWTRHTDGAETDTTDQKAVYDTTTNAWTLILYSFATHVVQNFNDTLVNSDSSKLDKTGSGATPTDPNGSDLETATGTDGSTGSITSDSLLIGNGQTYTQTQHRVVTWTFRSDQKLTDVGTVTAGLAGTGAAGAGTPPAVAGSDTDKNNDTWNRRTDGTEMDTTDQTTTYDAASKAWTLTAYSFGTHVVQNFTDTLVNTDSSKVDKTGSGATASDPNGSDLETATGTDGSTGSITSDSLLIGNGQTFIQTQHQVVSWTFSSDQKLTAVASMTAGLAGTGTSGTGTPPPVPGTETDKNNDTWNRHIDGAETDTTDQKATYDTTTKAWTLIAYSFGTHVVQNFTDSLVNNDSSKADETGSGATPTDPNGSDLQTATGTDRSSGAVTLDTLLTGNGQTYTQTKHQVVTWTFSSDQALTDVGTVTAGVAGIGASGSVNKQNNYTWNRHTDGTKTETTDQTALFNTVSNTWSISGYALQIQQVSHFTDTLINNDASSGAQTSTSSLSGGDSGTTTINDLLTGNGVTFTDVYDTTTSTTFNLSRNDSASSDIITQSPDGSPGFSQETVSNHTLASADNESTVTILHQESTYSSSAWTVTYFKQDVTDTHSVQSESADSTTTISSMGTATFAHTNGDSVATTYHDVREGSANQYTDTLDQTLTHSFHNSTTSSGPATGSGLNNSATGSATYTLHRVMSCTGSSAVVTAATLDVTGSISDSVESPSSVSIDVTTNPSASTTQIAENGINLFNNLNVTIGADANWLNSFAGSFEGTLQSHPRNAGSVTYVAGMPVSSPAPATTDVTNTLHFSASGVAYSQTTANVTYAATLNAAGQVLTCVTKDNTTGQILDSHTYTYDAAGNKLSQTDGEGRKTEWTYDSTGHKTSETLAAGTAQAATTTFTWQGNNLVAVTDPDGNTTCYGYDSLGREISMTDPLGNQETRGYDDAGRLAWVIDRDSQLTTYAYDPIGHLITETMYAGATDTTAVVDTLTWTYNADGTVATAGNNQGTYVYQYDALGRVSHVDEPSGISLTFGYDAAGNRNLVTDSLGGVEHSTYNASRQLVSRTLTQGGYTLRIDFTYTPQGRVATETRYSDAAGTSLVATTTYAYDAAGHVASIVSKDAANNTIANYAYTTDAAGDLTAQTENGVTSDFHYDAQGQLTSDGTNNNTYEANGNRTSAGYVTGPNNELLSDGTWNYTYDAKGNETGKVNIATGVSWKYGYDNRNELTKATEWSEDASSHPGTAHIVREVDYKYDVYGNRTEQDFYAGDPAITSAAVTRFAMDGWNPAKGTPIGNENFDVWADLSGNGELQTRYLRGDAVDQLLARIDRSGSALSPYWELSDRLGSVRDVIDNSGAVQDAITYDGFGNITSETGAAYRGRYTWTGRELDVETGLQYNRARYYDSTTGRWISQDPMGFDAGDSNLYRYVHNRPQAATDPSGRDGVSYDDQIWDEQEGHRIVWGYTLDKQKHEWQKYDTGLRLVYEEALRNGRIGEQYVAPAGDTKGMWNIKDVRRSLQGVDTVGWSKEKRDELIAKTLKENARRDVPRVFGEPNDAVDRPFLPEKAPRNLLPGIAKEEKQAPVGDMPQRAGWLDTLEAFGAVFVDAMTFHQIPGLNADAQKAEKELGAGWSWTAKIGGYVTTGAIVLGGGFLLVTAGGPGAAVIGGAGALGFGVGGALGGVGLAWGALTKIGAALSDAALLAWIKVSPLILMAQNPAFWVKGALAVGAVAFMMQPGDLNNWQGWKARIDAGLNQAGNAFIWMAVVAGLLPGPAPGVAAPAIAWPRWGNGRGPVGQLVPGFQGFIGRPDQNGVIVPPFAHQRFPGGVRAGLPRGVIPGGGGPAQGQPPAPPPFNPLAGMPVPPPGPQGLPAGGQPPPQLQGQPGLAPPPATGTRAREILRQSLGANPYPVEEEGHHILGVGLFDSPLGQRLHNWGIDLNSADNGVLLPRSDFPGRTASIHRGRPSAAYTDEVTRRLNAATTRDEALEILEDIRQDLLHGRLSINNAQ